MVNKLMISGLCILILMAGCSGSQNQLKTIRNDDYDDARKAAWHFVKEKSWDDTAEENWQSAAVTKTVAANEYEWLDASYKQKELLLISFQEKENTVSGTPLILVSPDTGKVVGYMPGE